MKLKIDEKGNAVLQDGMPVYVHPDGTESAHDAKALGIKVATLNRENGAYRTENKEYKEKLAAFSGIESPEEALKALQFMVSMDGKKVMDDEGIQKLVQAAVKPLQEKLTATESALSEKDGHIYKLEIGGKFQSSQFIKEKLLIPPDMLQATFGNQLSMENGKFVAKDAAGNQIFNVKGEPASFDEAMQTLIDAHPMKDTIYRASGATGSGQLPSNATGGNDFSKLGLSELTKRQNEPAVAAYIQTLK